MNLSEPFIRRPVMTTLFMLAIVLLGIMSYFRLPVSNLPDVNYPSINVEAALPGASPETMANTVATPLEKEFLTIPGVKNVTSSNTLGNTKIVIQFDISIDVDEAAVDVQAAITRAKTKLPPNLPNDPTYKKVNPADTPILYIVVTSATMPLKDLYTYGNTVIGQKISTVNGVAQVFTYGSPFAVRVQMNPGNLSSLGITLKDVSEALSQGNQNLPTGQLDGGNISSVINTDGQLKTAKEYDPLVVSFRNQSPVRIQDLGVAVDSLQNDRLRLRYVDKEKDQPCVVLAVLRQPGANTVKVSDAIGAFLPQLISELPGSVQLIIVFDRSQSVKDSIADVKLTLFLAFVLVVLVIFLYLGKLQDTLIPSLILPMSIVGTFPFMWLLGYTIDSLSLLAFTLAIGFIIDDAIVVLENIVRRIEGGETPWTAALNGSAQISFTILSMTLSLIAVFIPMLFMGGLIGKIFQEFAVVLAIVTLLSGLISLTLTPMLCSRFIPSREKIHGGRYAGFSEKMNKKMLAWYTPMLEWVLSRRRIALAAGGVCIILTVYLFYILPTDFIPDDDIGFVLAFNQAGEGTSSSKMVRYQDKFVEVMQNDPNVASFVSIAASPSFRDGINFIRLVPYEKRKSSTKIIQEWYGKVMQIPGLRTFFKNVPLIDLSIGAANKGSYQYALQSLSTQDLYVSAQELIAKMNAESEIFEGITSDLEIKTPQLYVEILRNQASSLGVTAESIEEALLLAFSGNRVSRIQTPIDQYDVILELEKQYQRDPASLSTIYVRNKDANILVPLSSVARWKEGVGPNSINHISQFPSVTITFNVKSGVPLGTALGTLKRLASETLKPDVTGAVQGAAETFEEAIRSAAWLLLFSVIAIYIILGMLYESFVHPLTILSTLLPAALGGLITLWIFGMPLSLYAYLGIILLIGIVKKNGIMMVDYALDNLRHKHETPERAIYDACLVRFRPIMMTTMAAIFGAIPIALGIGAGAEARRPLGIVIIGGLIFSQMITLFLTPVIYLYLENIREKYFQVEPIEEEIPSHPS